MAWFVLSGKSHTYNCESCPPDYQEARNCGGEHGTEFSFQIGYDKHADSFNQRKFIKECPVSFLENASFLIWQRYQDHKLKKELGIVSDPPSKFLFEAFKVLTYSIDQHETYERDEQEKKNKREQSRRKRR